MPFKGDTSNYFKPFLKNSINVISSSSNSGKTTAVLNFIKNRNIYFAENFNKLICVLCNERVENTLYQKLEDDSLQVEVCYLDEFLPEEQLSENVCLVFDDVTKISEEINTIIRVSSHHQDLNSVFIITQSVLEDDEFKKLLTLSHTILIFFNGIQATKIANYIKRNLIVNRELKDLQ